jgi:two-component system response regulator FixJ
MGYVGLKSNYRVASDMATAMAMAIAELRIRVAVVDDDASVRKALGRLLRAAAFDLETFASGAELLAALDSFKPHCVILDLHMQDLNGLDIQRHLSRMGLATPVIVITGHDSPKARAESLALGAKAYLFKPIEAETLIATIQWAVATADIRV